MLFLLFKNVLILFIDSYGRNLGINSRTNSTNIGADSSH